MSGKVSAELLQTDTDNLFSGFIFKDFTCSCASELNSALRLCPQIVLLMQSRRTSRTSHSPLNHRRLPTVAEETPPVGNPASSWVESAFFFLFVQFFSFYFFKNKCPTSLFLHISPPPASALHLCHTHPSPHLLFVHPQPFCFYPFFSIKTQKNC